MMRVMLYEAAHIMLVRSTKWCWLKAWAMQIAMMVKGERYRNPSRLRRKRDRAGQPA